MNRIKIVFFLLLPCVQMALAQTPYRGDGKALMGIAHQVIEQTSGQLAEDKTMPRWAYQISFVVPDSAAFKGGLQSGDVLLAWDNHTLDEVSTAERSTALRDYLKQQKRIGEPLSIRFLRYSVQLGDSTPVSSAQLKNDWLSYLKHPQKNQTKRLELIYHVKVFDKVINLGKRYDDIALVTKSELLSEILTMQDKKLAEFAPTDWQAPLYELPQTLVSTFNLSVDYADLIDRFEEDEKWQRRFINQHFQYAHREPFKLLPMMDDYTTTLKQQSTKGITSLMRFLGRQFTTTSTISSIPLSIPTSEYLADHLEFINQVLALAHQERKQALRQLNTTEQETLINELPQLMDRFAHSYYIHHNNHDDSLLIHRQNQKLLSLLEKVEISAFIRASDILLLLKNKTWLKHLQQQATKWRKEAKSQTTTGVLGKIIASQESSYGRVIIGDMDNNIYTEPATVIIDLGGNDKYYGANTPSQVPINALIDWQGDDLYSSTLPFAQGSTLLGVSLLFDFSGDDRYVSAYYTQGVAIGGVAMVYDASGDDHYKGQRFAQGVGFWGVGILFDRAGDDRYSAWRYAQGVGGVAGVGLLLDVRGQDHYEAIGESRSSYGTIGNFQASSQGFGVGFRGYVPGGIGLLLDGGGQDNYQAGNFAQGVGYFFALGVLRDFGEDNDVYHASRYGMGASAHSAAGVLIEDGGNDRYAGNHIALIGSAWDLGLAAFWDKQGDDVYRDTARGFTMGVAAHNGHSVFLDSQGRDRYRIDPKQWQVPSNQYHGGYSFAFFIDAGGEEDDYRYEKLANNSFLYEYGHGFMIDLSSPLTAQSQGQFWSVQ